MPTYAVRRQEFTGQAQYGTLRRTPKWAVVATGLTEADAAARVEAETAAAWAAPDFNPFHYGPLFYLTALPEPQLRDWLLDHEVPPPDGPDWVAWYAALPPGEAGDRARRVVREALAKLRFFEAARERPKAYAVVEINWTWNDNSFLDADPEGGQVLEAYRRRADADAACALLNEERRAEGDHNGYDTFLAEERPGFPAEVTPIAETVFFEVIEVEVAEGEGAA